MDTINYYLVIARRAGSFNKPVGQEPQEQSKIFRIIIINIITITIP